MTARGAIHGRGKTSTIRLGAIFSPLALVVLLYVPLLVLYAASSPEVFATEFDSRKTLTWTGLAFFALALVVFAAGAKAGDDGARAKLRAGQRSAGMRDLTRSQRRSLEVLLEVALALSVVAYVTWFGRGIVHAGGVEELIEIWRSQPHRIKGEVMTTIPGVTTLTQLAVAAIPLAIAYKLARRGSVIRILIVAVLALAAARAVLLNERLALLELLVPMLFLATAPRRVTVPRVVIYGLAFGLAALTFFAATELRRTYVYTDDFSPGRATTRFFGYYLTSVNNGVAIVDEYPARTPFYSSGAFLWQLPAVGDLRLEHLPTLGTVSLRYQDLFGVEPNSFWRDAFATQGLDYEFNVFSTPGFLAADFGWAALIGVLVLGLLSGVLYRRSLSDPFIAALYAVWLVGLLEFMRILYFTNTRLFPAYLVFLAAYLVVRRAPAFTPVVRRADLASQEPSTP